MRTPLKFIPIGIALIFNSAKGAAQVKNHTAEDFAKGTQLVFQTCESDGVTTPSGGKNVTWDYSKLKKKENDSTIEKLVAPKETPFAKQYPTANLAEYYSNGRYVFLHKTAQQSLMLGYVDSMNGMNARFEKPVLIAQRPFSYGDNVKDNFTTAYTVQKMDFKGTGDVTITSDGYGTLLLPNGKFDNVISMKISQIQRDTLIQYSSLNITEITTYVWFDNTHKSALLKITDVKSANYTSRSVEYLLKEQKM